MAAPVFAGCIPAHLADYTIAGAQRQQEPSMLNDRVEEAWHGNCLRYVMWRAYAWTGGQLARIEGGTRDELRRNFLSWAVSAGEFKTAFPYETLEGRYVLADRWLRVADDCGIGMLIGNDDDLWGYIEKRRLIITYAWNLQGYASSEGATPACERGPDSGPIPSGF